MSRFDNEVSIAAQMPGGAANALVAGNPGLGPLAKRLMMDPDIDEDEALSLIQLPAQTMYLIDKVVRQKAKNGPIGIDNSEVINLQVENDFKNRHNHILKLNNATSGAEIDFSEGYVDEEGVFHPIDQDEKLFKENERLLTRLTLAANKGASKKNLDMTSMSKSQFNGDMTSNTEGIINISNNDMNPSSNKAKVMELIQDHVNDRSGTNEQS